MNKSGYHVHTPSPLKQQTINTDKCQHHTTTLVSEKTMTPPPTPLVTGDSKENNSMSEGDIDDDKDHDFDWEDDDENQTEECKAASIKRHATVKRMKGVYKKYCCWHYLSQFMKRVVIAVVGSTIFITVGVCVYLYVPIPSQEDLASPEFTNIRANVQVWMYWAAFMWHIAWIVTFLIQAVPIVVYKWVKFFRGRKSEKVKTYMEVMNFLAKKKRKRFIYYHFLCLQYYMSLKLFIGFAIITAFNWGTWAFLIYIPYSVKITRQYFCNCINSCLF